ncbi:MAG: T9SS type A sorting domain-containing protein [Saprospiraceae bacterium]
MPLGTELENRAGIYFDFNAPVMTNTAFHVLGEDLILNTDDTFQTTNDNLNVVIQPHPISDNAMIFIGNFHLQNADFQLFTPIGQLVETLPIKKGQAVLKRENLAAGVYFYRIQQEGQLLGSGKLLIQ